MRPTAYLIVSLCLTSALLSIIFWIAWRSFGRQRHALTWSLAFAVATVQWVVNLNVASFGDWRVYWTVVNAIPIVAVTLALIGHRQRAELAPLVSPLALGGTAVWAGVVWFTWVQPHVGLQMALQPAYAGVLIGWAALILYRFRARPRPADLGAAAVHLSFAVSQIAAATFALLQGPTRDAVYFQLYLAINFLAMPAAYSGMGLFVVFILASDLAEQMRELAVTDPLTGLLNRRGFEESAARVLAQAQRGGRPLSLVLGDLDHFKSVNDTWGHAVGDLALRLFADELRRDRRREDLAARVGGEEFVVLLPNTRVEQAVAIAEGIRERLHEAELPGPATEVHVSASFGVSANEATESLEELLDARRPRTLPRQAERSEPGRSGHRGRRVGQDQAGRLRAASTTACAVIPRCSMTFGPGALMPKRSMPTTLPSVPTYFHQRPVTPASMATRLAQAAGSTLFAVLGALAVEALEAGHGDDADAVAEFSGGGQGVLQFAAAWPAGWSPARRFPSSRRSRPGHALAALLHGDGRSSSGPPGG